MNEKSIVIGGDHAGFEYKASIIKMLEEEGYTVKDFGTNSGDSVDYPDYAHPLAKWIEDGKAPFGITLCGSGNGIAITLYLFTLTHSVSYQQNISLAS